MFRCGACPFIRNNTLADVSLTSINENFILVFYMFLYYLYFKVFLYSSFYYNEKCYLNEQFYPFRVSLLNSGLVFMKIMRK